MNIKISGIGSYIPEKSISIIGSQSKNHSGELYTIDVAYKINQPINKRNKRLMDIFISILFLFTFPIFIFFV